MNNEIVYALIMAVITGIVMLRAKDRPLALLLVTLIISPWQGGLWIKGYNQDLLISTVYYLALMVYVFFSGKRRGSHRLLDKLYGPVFWPALGFIICTIISATVAIDLPAARGGVIISIERYIVFFVVFNLVRKPQDVKWVLLALAVSMIFQGIIGLIQFKFYSFQIGVIDGAKSGMSWRANGTFFHSNALGMYLLLILTLIYRMVLLSMKGSRSWIKGFYFAVFILGCGTLLATLNRGSWIGFAVAMFAIVLVDTTTGRTRVYAAMAQLAIPVLIVFMLISVKYGGVFVTRFFHDDLEHQIEERRLLQQDAYNVIKAHPVIGVGWGNYKQHAGTREFAHNLFLLITAELGVAGSFFFFWFLLAWLWEIYKGWRSGNLMVRNLSVGALGGFVGFIVASIPGPDYVAVRQTGTHVWIVLGLMAALNRMAKEYSRQNVAMVADRKKLDAETRKRMEAYVGEQWRSILS